MKKGVYNMMNRIGSHKTSVINDDNILLVAYHSTIVVKVVNSQYVVLKSGGWLTPTTKRRMNQASNQYRLNFRVFQKGWVWFVETPNSTIEYYEGMIIDIVNGSPQQDALTIMVGALSFILNCLKYCIRL